MIGNAVRDEHRYRRSRREYELFAKGHLLHHHHQYPVVLMGITPTAPLQFKNVIHWTDDAIIYSSIKNNLSVSFHVEYFSVRASLHW